MFRNRIEDLLNPAPGECPAGAAPLEHAGDEGEPDAATAPPGAPSPPATLPAAAAAPGPPQGLSYASMVPPVRLARHLRAGAAPRFGVLLRPDRALPPGAAPVEAFRCDECGATRTPEKRMGPKGPRTLCNRCGLIWSRAPEGSRNAEVETKGEGAEDSEA